MGAFEDLNDAGLRAIALTPEWVDQDATADSYTGAPTSQNAGVYLQGSPRCVIHVALRAHVHRREAHVTMITLDTGATYTVTIDGHAIAKATPTSENNLLTSLAASINASGTVNTIVTASALDSDGVDVSVSGNPAVELFLVGVEEDDWSLDIGATGTGALAATADASTCGVRLFATPGGIIKDGSTGNANGWVKPANAAWSVDYRGLMERADCAGFDRGYLELYTIDGHASDGASVELTIAKVMIGPAVLQGSS
jgi:hypothetical protein